jgi:hypothetical protein
MIRETEYKLKECIKRVILIICILVRHTKLEYKRVILILEADQTGVKNPLTLLGLELNIEAYVYNTLSGNIRCSSPFWKVPKTAKYQD